jgi:hypothetical protein
MARQQHHLGTFILVEELDGLKGLKFCQNPPSRFF